MLMARKKILIIDKCRQCCFCVDSYENESRCAKYKLLNRHNRRIGMYADEGIPYWCPLKDFDEIK